MVEGKPSQKEQDYFLRIEAERIKKLREEHEANIREAERKKLKELHYMCCPKCGMKMTTSNLADVEIDVCPDCGGIYLDSGELGKILENSKRNPVLDRLMSIRKILLR